MTNTSLLREIIDKKGYKLSFVAKSLGLSYQGFLNKLTNKSEFIASEILILCKLLDLDDEMRNRIFFAEKVDETSTI